MKTYVTFGMQAYTSYCSDLTSGDAGPSPHHPAPPVAFVITPQDSLVLQEHISQFQNGSPSARANIIEKLIPELYQLQPSNTPFDKKDAGKKIQKWFYNHYLCLQCQYTKFTHKWSSCSAFYQLNRDEVLELAWETSGMDPGAPGFLGALQDATTMLWNTLDTDDQQDYAQAARSGHRMLHPPMFNPGWHHPCTRDRPGLPEATVQNMWYTYPCAYHLQTKDNDLSIGLLEDCSPLGAMDSVGINCFSQGFITGRKNQVIPWGSLVNDPLTWIPQECIPDGFEWKDPSKIQIGEIFCLLDHWRDCQDQGHVPLTWVPSCLAFHDEIDEEEDEADPGSNGAVEEPLLFVDSLQVGPDMAGTSAKPLVRQQPYKGKGTCKTSVLGPVVIRAVVVAAEVPLPDIKDIGEDARVAESDLTASIPCQIWLSPLYFLNTLHDFPIVYPVPTSMLQVSLNPNFFIVTTTLLQLPLTILLTTRTQLPPLPSQVYQDTYWLGMTTTLCSKAGMYLYIS
ncbi:hypothetical protein EI94DRAFT_1704048 [Lactarius quietus]|nr:hypothetical protein EI94DRAFT_1704048 [Lactarius quietus]